MIRVSYYCGHCERLHKHVGSLAKMLHAVQIMLSIDATASVLLEDEAAAVLLDRKEADGACDDMMRKLSKRYERSIPATQIRGVAGEDLKEGTIVSFDPESGEVVKARIG